MGSRASSVWALVLLVRAEAKASFPSLCCRPCVLGVGIQHKRFEGHGHSDHSMFFVTLSMNGTDPHHEEWEEADRKFLFHVPIRGYLQ